MNGRKQRIIGILGGIGSGKSAVARILEETGAGVVDADRIAGECLGLLPIRQRIADAFGRAVLDDDGAVDRKALADLVFSSDEERRKLHAIIHPEIRTRMRREIERFRARDGMELIVIDAPLLLESIWRDECDALLLVRSPREDRIRRVREARGWDAAEHARRESLQASLSEKESAADVIVDNDGSLENLEDRVRKIRTALADPGSGRSAMNRKENAPDAAASGKKTIDGLNDI